MIDGTQISEEDIENIVRKIKRPRTDLSTFLVHLTRDTSAEGGGTPEQNLHSILDVNPKPKIKALNRYGLFCDSTLIDKVICFTEAPLDQVKYIEKSSKTLSDFGLVFSLEFVRNRGGNPTFYINTYDQNKLKDSMTYLFNNLQNINNKGLFKSIKNLAPFINTFGKTSANSYADYSCEREWRIVGDLTFDFNDVIIGLCPHYKINDFEHKYKKKANLC